MNPNFMGNISPQQIDNNLSMMKPEMNKSPSNMISGMSDSEIQDYLSQIGMPGINPSKFRSICQNMSNMNDSPFNSMEDLPQDNIKNTNYNYYNNKSGIVQFITNMKEEGNKLFRSGKYKKAIEKYYETIKKIKAANDKEKYKPELDNIERICRLNIANCRLKTGDYDGVIDECSIVLESSKCFKGYYRMGLALMKKNKFDKAYKYLNNANAIGTLSEKKAVEPYLKECKEKLEEIKKKQREERLIKENEENQKQKEEQKNNNEPEKLEKKENDNRFNTLRNIFKKEKFKNKKEKIEEEDIKVEDGIKVKDFNKKYNINIHTESCKCCHSNNNSNNMSNIDNQNHINKTKGQISNISDEQLNLLVKQMKNMDNQALKRLMISQGMTLTDQQIDMMKMSMTPETLKIMRNPNFQSSNRNYINSNISNNQTSQAKNNNNTNMPNLANMDIQQMINFMKKNPELFKMISPQLSSMVQGRDADPEIMMESMEKIFRIFNFLEQIINVLFSWRGVCIIILIIAIIYALIKKLNQ